MAYLWGMLSTISFLSVYGLVAVSTPGASSTFMTIFLSFAQLDILPTEFIFPCLFTFDEFTDEAYNPYFDTMGISSLNSLNNMGSAYIFLMMNLGFLGITFIFFISRRVVNRLKKIYKWFRKTFLWNYMIRFYMAQYFTIVLASFLNMRRVSIKI